MEVHATYPGFVSRQRARQLGVFQVPNLQRTRLRAGAHEVFRLAEAYAFYRSGMATQALKKKREHESHCYFNKFEFNNNIQGALSI